MPIDPRKFEKIVTKHFENITEAEFLETLSRSRSRILFEGELKEREELDIQQLDRHEDTNPSDG